MGNEIRATLRINGDPAGALATVQTVTAQARAMGAEAIQINQKVSAFAQQNINDVKARITTLQGELTRLRGVRAALPASTSISNQVKVDNQILRTAQALSKAELDLAKAQSSRITMTAKTNDQLNKQINSSNNMVAAFARVKKAMQEVTQAASALNQAGQHMGATLNMIPSAGSKLSHVGAILANLVTMGGKTAAVFGNLGIAMGKLGAGGIQGLQKVGGMFSKLVSGADQAKKKMEQVGYGLISSGTHLGDLAIRLQGAQVAVYGLGGALTRMGATGKQAIQDVIGVAADFQQKIVTLQAILGSAGANLAGPLRDLAITLSEKSPFAPGEVADVISELVKGGVQIKDVMGGAAEAVMNLSTATGQDLKQSIQSVISATNDWANQGLKATDAVNSMTKVANATASDVNQLAAGMKNAGAVAASMGVNFDNTIQMLGALSNAGLKGAEGGTALRYFLLNLVPSTNKQINMMKDLNLMTYDYAQALELASQKHIKLTGNQEVDMNRLYQQFAQTKKTFQQAIEDGDRGVSQFQQYLSAHGVVTSQFVDTATHQLKDASDILQIIYDKVYSKVGGGVEGTKLLSQLFGERGGSKAAATMMLAFQKNLDEYNNLKERIKTETGAQLEEDQKLLDKMDANLIKTIRNQLDGYGSATEIAKARTETFTGSLHFLQSSLDGLKIILGDSLLQPLAKFLHMLGDLVNKASDFFKLNPQVAEAAGKFLLFGTAAASVIGPLLVLVATLPYVITAFSAIIANMSMVVVGVTAVGVALSLLAGAAYVVAQSMNPQSPMFTAMNQLVSFLKGTVDSLKQIATEGFVNIMVPIMKAMEQGMATVVIPSFMKLTDAVLKLTPVLVNGFGKVLQGIILPALSAVGQAIKNYAVPAIIGFMNVIKTIAPGIVNGSGQRLQDPTVGCRSCPQGRVRRSAQHPTDQGVPLPNPAW
jgi:TP901 family phage tail tape measure protein